MAAVNAGQKALMIGLDGVPYTLIQAYIEKGVLPNIAKILSKGFALKQMDASIPDVSSTSWASFFTGVNPAEHGIFGFMGLKKGTYSLTFPNYEDIKAPAIWEILGKRDSSMRSSLSDEYNGRVGKPFRSIVLNIPQTYPARAINGLLTAGFVCPDFKKGTYPPSLYEYLTKTGYMPDIDSNKAASDKDGFFRDLFTSLDRREEAYLHLFDNEQWDLFAGVFTETDRMHHFFFDAAYDEAHPFHERFVECYRKIDSIIGAMYSRFHELTGGKGLFMTMSDHGFTVIKKEVYLNAWLKKNGFLRLDAAREFFDQIGTGTKAFCMDPSRIYINSEGKYPRGSVKDGEKSIVAAELAGMLRAMTDNDGSPVIKTVYRKEEIYSGSLFDEAPDLVCLANDGFDLKGNLKKEEVFGSSHFRGMHTRYDAHCILPEASANADRLHIEGLGRIILNNFI